MSDKEKFENSVNFVVGHYRRDAFVESRAWRSLGIASGGLFGLGRRAAAAIIAGVVLAASACVFTFVVPRDGGSPEADVPAAVGRPSAAVQSGEVRKIEFSDATLDDVADEIERVYGVRIVNRPEGDYRLTLSYEGDADSLVDTINSLLDINLEVER